MPTHSQEEIQEGHPVNRLFDSSETPGISIQGHIESPAYLASRRGNNFGKIGLWPVWKMHKRSDGLVLAPQSDSVATLIILVWMGKKEWTVWWSLWTHTSVGSNRRCLICCHKTSCNSKPSFNKSHYIVQIFLKYWKTCASNSTGITMLLSGKSTEGWFSQHTYSVTTSGVSRNKSSSIKKKGKR